MDTRNGIVPYRQQTRMTWGAVLFGNVLAVAAGALYLVALGVTLPGVWLAAEGSLVAIGSCIMGGLYLAERRRVGLAVAWMVAWVAVVAGIMVLQPGVGIMVLQPGVGIMAAQQHVTIKEAIHG